MFTQEHMLAKGATDVSAVKVGEEENHEECTYPALLFAKLWFDSFLASPTKELVSDEPGWRYRQVVIKI